MTTYKSFIGGKDINFWDGVSRTFTRKTSTGGQLSLNRVGPLVDVLEVYGSGTAYTDSTISTALGRIGSASVGLLLQPGTWTISNDLTIPANTPLYLMPGAVLSVQPAKTLTINSQPEAGRYQIFAVVEDTEAGTIGEFSFASGLHLKSSWFASLTSATTIIDSDAVTLEITKAETVSADTTVAATTTLMWLSKNILTISAAKTLTINGLIHAGLHQIFAATGTVTLGGLLEKVYPQWFGAVGDGTTDDSAAINACISSGKTVYLPAGSYKVTDALTTITTTGQVIRGEARDKSFIVVEDDFNMVATGVFVTSISDSSPELHSTRNPWIKDLTIHFEQPDTAVRANLNQYPPAIKTSVGGINIDNVRIMRAWNGIQQTSASNSTRIDDLDISAFSVAIDIDGAVDSTHMTNVHVWPFGCTANQSSITYETAAIGLKLGDVDDFHVDNSLFYVGTPVYLHNPGTGYPWGMFTNTSFDGFSGFIMEDGTIVVNSCRFSLGDYDKRIIYQTGGRLTVGDSVISTSTSSASNPLIDASGSYFNLNNSYISTGSIDVKVVSIDSSVYATIIGNGFYRTANEAYTNSTIYLASGSLAKVLSNHTLGPGTGSGNFIEAAADNDHVIIGNDFNGYTASLPAGSANLLFEGNIDYQAAIPDIASAGTITLSAKGDFFNITGTTNITSVTASRIGRLVTLKFAGVLTFTDGSNLKLAGDFVTTADDTITLRSDGTNWNEVARSAN